MASARGSRPCADSWPSDRGGRRGCATPDRRRRARSTIRRGTPPRGADGRPASNLVKYGRPWRRPELGPHRGGGRRARRRRSTRIGCSVRIGDDRGLRRRPARLRRERGLASACGANGRRHRVSTSGLGRAPEWRGDATCRPSTWPSTASTRRERRGGDDDQDRRDRRAHLAGLALVARAAPRMRSSCTAVATRSADWSASSRTRAREPTTGCASPIAATLEVVVAVLRGLVNTRRSRPSSTEGRRAAGLTGADGGLLQLRASRPRARRGRRGHRRGAQRCWRRW